MSNKRTGILIIALFIIVLFVAFYYFLIFPKKTEVAMKETAVLSIESEIQLLEAQIEASGWDKQIVESEFILQKIVPITRELDQIIRSIEEVELISDSQIQSVTFNNYDEVLSGSEIIASTQETEDGQVVQSEATEEADETVTTDIEVTPEPVSPIDLSALPPELKLITFNINVSTKDYEQLKLFIRELEQLERVLKIEGVKFTLPGEVEVASEEEIKLAVNADILITTFYYDGVIE